MHKGCLNVPLWKSTDQDPQVKNHDYPPLQTMRRHEIFVTLLESQDECCYDTRCYFNVCSKADVSQLNLGHTHTRLTALFSGTTQVSRYQKGKTSLDFTEARDSEWQWQQLGHMQICTLLQTDNHTSSPPLCFYRPDALPATQPTASKHWRQLNLPHGTKNLKSCL